MEKILPTVVFGLLAVLLIGSALIVVTSRSIFRSAIALTAALSTVAGLFALLGADFVAAGQLLIYVGGIMIIMLFVVMLSHEPLNIAPRQTNAQWKAGLLVAGLIAISLLLQLGAVFSGVLSTVPPTPTTASVGRVLLREMIVPFEAISLLLLTALVGAVYFGQSQGRNP